MAEQGLHQTQGLSLQTTITPQMQQSLQVLQAPTLELRQLVQHEMLENPALEDEYQEISLEEEGLDRDDFDKEFEELSRLDQEWRDLLVQSRQAKPRNSEDEERRAFLMDSVTAPVTLQQHLLEQLSVADVNEPIRSCTELLVGMVNEQGMLSSSIEDLSFSERIPLDDLIGARDLLQSFHPVGVGAIDLRECLMIQLDRLGKAHSLESRIVGQHLQDLAMKRYPMIARRLGATLEQIVQAAEFIATLNPRPGQMFQQSQNHYVTPDVNVEWYRGEYRITLNNSQVPQLRISNTYKDIMAQGSNGADVRKYIREKIRSGKFLIRSIHQRQETIEKIAREIVKHQEAFLDSGTAYLRPLNMAQVADAVGVHETTVSRAVSGKYMATPHGTFEMKYFFTTGYQKADGESMSNTSVKNALMEIVKGETSGKAFSDKELVDMLQERGIPIARRTVAKYRKELNILPSNMRRKY